MENSTYKLTVLQWAQTKTAVCFASMAYTKISKIVFEATVWKRSMDDIFSLWDLSNPEQVNLHYPTIKFTIKIH